jgi:hypothetical protein
MISATDSIQAELEARLQDEDKEERTA